MTRKRCELSCFFLQFKLKTVKIKRILRICGDSSKRNGNAGSGVLIINNKIDNKVLSLCIPFFGGVDQTKSKTKTNRAKGTFTELEWMSFRCRLIFKHCFVDFLPFLLLPINNLSFPESFYVSIMKRRMGMGNVALIIRKSGPEWSRSLKHKCHGQALHKKSN